MQNMRYTIHRELTVQSEKKDDTMIPVSVGSGILRSHRKIAKQEIQAAKMKRDIHMHQIGRKGLIARLLLGIKF